VEIYDIAMAQTELARSHVAVDVIAVPIMCEGAEFFIRFEDINLDAPDILISPPSADATDYDMNLKADLFARYLAFDSVAGSERHCDEF
jgi:hypothetical protein